MPILPITNGCTGCGSYMQVCGKQAIQMVENTEGFLNPSVDSKKYVDCAKKKCYALNRSSHDLSNKKHMPI